MNKLDLVLLVVVSVWACASLRLMAAEYSQETERSCRSSSQKLASSIISYKKAGGDPMDLYKPASGSELGAQLGNYMLYLAGGSKKISESDLVALGFSKCMSLKN